MSRTVSSFLAIVLIAAAGVPLWIFVIAKKTEPPPASPRVVSAALVDTRRVRPEDFDLEIEAFGTLLPARRAGLVAERPGRVIWVHPDWRPGLVVEANELLLRIDPVPFELELERAKAAREEALAGLEAAKREGDWSQKIEVGARRQAEIAQRELVRLEGLEARGQVGASLVDGARTSLVRSELEVENARGRVSAAVASESAAEARLLQSRVMIEMAEDSLSRTIVSAPFEGRLAGRAPALASYLAAGTALGECLDLSQLHLVAQIHSEHLDVLGEGQSASLYFPSRPEYTTEGVVRAISPVVDPFTRSAAVEIEIDNSAVETSLPMGLFARAVVHAGQRQQVLWIDRRHLVWKAERPTAWLLSADQKSQQTELVLGAALGEGFAVLSGLADGDELITGPLDRLVDGEACLRRETQEGSSEQ